LVQYGIPELHEIEVEAEYTTPVPSLSSLPLYVSLTAIRFILYQGADASPVPYSLNHHHLFIVTYPSTYSHMHYLTSISASGHRVPVRIAHRMELQLNYTHYLPL